MPEDRHVVAILAGGESRRMNRLDKALVEIAGRRLIDIVVDRLLPQASRVVISGPSDFETGLTVVPDEPDTPRGPVAGVLAVRRWLAANEPGSDGFVTAPVDGPFVARDLVERLTRQDRSAIGSDMLGEHPAFGYWRTLDLDLAFPQVPPGSDLPLRTLAMLCDARLEVFDDTRSLFNLNDPEDLRLARKVLEG